MYTRLPIIEWAERRAEAVVAAERRRFDAVYAAGERVAAARGLAAFGDVAVQLLAGAPLPERSAPRLDFVSGDAEADARALADALHEADPDGLGLYAAALTKVPRQLFVVTADDRALFGVHSMPVYRGVAMAELLETVERPAPHAPDVTLAVVGAELQLISVYAALCDPGRASEWPALLEAETTLRAQLEAPARGGCESDGCDSDSEKSVTSDGFSSDDEIATGGDDFADCDDMQIASCGDTQIADDDGMQIADDDDSQIADGGDSKVAVCGGRAVVKRKIAIPPHRKTVIPPKRHAAQQHSLYTLLRDEYSRKRVLVGPVALAALAGRPLSGRIQVVATQPLDKEKAAIETLARRAGAEVVCRVEDPRIPGDARLRRMTVHAVVGGRRDLIAEVYNAGGHEAVPWLEAAGRRVGTPFVLARFRLVDAWTLLVLRRMGVLDSTRLRAEALAGFREAARLAETLDAADVLPGERYVGSRESAELAARRRAPPAATYFALTKKGGDFIACNGGDFIACNGGDFIACNGGDFIACNGGDVEVPPPDENNECNGGDHAFGVELPPPDEDYEHVYWEV
jgi:hypothetical protein